MAAFEDDQDDTELNLDTPIDDEDQDDEQNPDVNDSADEPDDEDDTPIIGFGDDIETEALSDSDLVKHLRKQLREARKTPAQAANDAEIVIPELGPEPTLESCDYDEARLQRELRAHVAKEAEIERLTAQASQKKESAKAQWQATWDDFATKRDALRVKDFEDAETTVLTTLTKEQQLIIVGGCENSAAMLYALGKSPTKLNEIAAVKDPLKFAVALGKLEKDLKVQRRKPPTPDTPARGSAPMSQGAVDKKLEQLEKEADKTGDRSKVIAYNREKRAKKAA
ncbi:hypothetical protein [Sphingomonas sp. SRS2]|uniref:hypothetical protein n=1 Tax=Sphingomonas sp. SRS2 TaxID=133190 RepID=UPI000618462E|nr:hypothetical protein [Sphingomonas sp. SRS2]KKC25825.1 hypothetical protein WP12_12285 [Sphingomonas sp. SRS2]